MPSQISRSAELEPPATLVNGGRPPHSQRLDISVAVLLVSARISLCSLAERRKQLLRPSSSSVSFTMSSEQAALRLPDPHLRGSYGLWPRAVRRTSPLRTYVHTFGGPPLFRSLASCIASSEAYLSASVFLLHRSHLCHHLIMKTFTFLIATLLFSTALAMPVERQSTVTRFDE